MSLGEEKAKQARFRRFIQFRLRSLLIIVLLSCLCLRFYPMIIHKLRTAILLGNLEDAWAERDAALKEWKEAEAKRTLRRDESRTLRAKADDEYFKARTKLETARTELLKYHDGSIGRLLEDEKRFRP